MPKNDIQQLVPEKYRELVEVVPKNTLRQGVVDALLLGGLLMAILCNFVSPSYLTWVLVIIFIAQKLRVRWSNRASDKIEAKMAEENLEWRE